MPLSPLRSVTANCTDTHHLFFVVFSPEFDTYEILNAALNVVVGPQALLR